MSVTKEEIIKRSDDLGIKLNEAQIELFQFLDKLPNTDFTSNKYNYNGAVFIPKDINLKSRNTYLRMYYKVIGKLKDYIDEYGSESGFMVFILEPENGQRITKLLLDGDFSVINYCPDDPVELLNYRRFVTEVITDFFYTSREFILA